MFVRFFGCLLVLLVSVDGLVCFGVRIVCVLLYAVVLVLCCLYCLVLLCAWILVVICCLFLFILVVAAGWCLDVVNSWWIVGWDLVGCRDFGIRFICCVGLDCCCCAIALVVVLRYCVWWVLGCWVGFVCGVC